MAEPTVSEGDVVPEELTLLWRCKNGHKHETLVFKGKVFVPVCGTCPNNRRYSEAIILPAKTKTAGMRVTPDKVLGRREALWVHFTSLLDKMRVMMASGEKTNTICELCKGKAHPAGRCVIDCPCHAAWEYRRTIEAEQDAQPKVGRPASAA